MYQRSAFVVAFVAAVLISASAFGQGYRWLETSPVKFFTDKDWTMLKSTARKLLDSGADGAEGSWENPDSGSHGTIKVLNTYKYEGLRCRRTHFSNSAGGFHSSGIYGLCKVADGTWKVAG